MRHFTVIIFTFGLSATLAADTPFCYRDSEGCGPGTEVWPPACHNDKSDRQTPIAFPEDIKPHGTVDLSFDGNYRNNFFRMSNNGHTVVVDFVGESGQNEGPTSNAFRFPDPLETQKKNPFKQNYKFAAAHFHWGANSSTEGSEHCLGQNCYAMELHLVHHSANYSSPGEALASGKGDALLVVGVWLKIGIFQSVSPDLPMPGNPDLAPIIEKLNKIRKPSHNGAWLRVDKTLDFTNLLKPPNQQVYTYRGSLTTPNCDEQVSWYMLKEPVEISTGDLRAFRTCLLDARGKPLDMNFRPLQNINGRQILLTSVKSVS